MSNGVLFSRPEDNMREEIDNDDPWDDTLLIKAYDRAVNLAKSNLEKNTQLGNQNKPNRTDGRSDSYKDNSRSHTGSSGQWKVGSYCRHVWSQDGVEYEAQIVSIKPQRNSVRVKFLGYNNEESTKLNSLKPSHGEEARQKQISESHGDHITEENGLPSQDFNASSSSIPQLDMDEGMMFPPPPPPHVISYLPKDEQEALSAMLMSWYMSGYHTGYYQGLLSGRQNPSIKKK